MKPKRLGSSEHVVYQTKLVIYLHVLKQILDEVQKMKVTHFYGFSGYRCMVRDATDNWSILPPLVIRLDKLRFKHDASCFVKKVNQGNISHICFNFGKAFYFTPAFCLMAKNIFAVISLAQQLFEQQLIGFIRCLRPPATVLDAWRVAVTFICSNVKFLSSLTS